jgi:uncharacterized protein
MAGIKRIHEFRDPLHDFVELNRQERQIVDSEPFQRLRHIHQLALTSLVYPGASHKRFEHSLGVMHLAQRAFDVVTSPQTRHAAIEHIIPDDDDLKYWRKAVAIAALCHDIGHLPFSHAAEKQLLPKGEDHESLTYLLIESDHIKPLLSDGQKIAVDDVQKLAVGKKKLSKKGIVFTDWEAILSEIIVGNAFGVDRMDYLLRDSYHIGTSYGRFDHKKLIDSLRILPASDSEEGGLEPTLGVDIGGLHSAEALLLARYFMYEQVYFHNVRRSYDFHLIQFMKSHYENDGGYRYDVEFHLSQTDNEVTAAIREAAKGDAHPGHEHAKAIMSRGHDRMIYSWNPSDQEKLKLSIESGRILPDVDRPLSPAYYVKKILETQFKCRIHTDLYIEGSSPNIFPVLMPDERIESSINLSRLLREIPSTTVDYIFCEKSAAVQVANYIKKHREEILQGS